MPHSAPPALDVDALLQRCMGNFELAERAIEAFLADFADSRRELEEAVEQGDAEAVGGLAHRMKGASSNVGAGGMAALLERLERQSASAAKDDQQATLLEVAQEFQRLEDSLL